ncbi:MAG: hypothetical protein K2I46_06380 [Clostridia bacterium]|nr:hypothetical protein [Clostridia bacterium]MDE6471938.1 hypothetical protein [Clostridia bacterium]
MNNNCTSLLLLVALLSFNNSCGCNNNCGCNNCNDCGCNCGCNSCNNNGLFGNNAGLLCLLLAFLSSANCPLTTSV